MNSIVRINGVSLIAPANPRLAADLGLVADPDQPAPADTQAALCPTEVTILQTLQGWRRSASISDLRDRLGLTPGQGTTLALYARRLEARGLVTVRNASSSRAAPVLILTLTGAGQEWTPAKPQNRLDPAAVLAIVREINARPVSGFLARAVAALDGAPRGCPATASAICLRVFDSTSGATQQRCLAALHALAASGHLTCRRHPRTGAAYFWSIA